MTSVIIPYRDRAEHLAILAPRLAQVLPDAEILVIEQAPGKPFNRAKLLNVGARISSADQYDDLIMHDVDKFPEFVKYQLSVYCHIAQLEKSYAQPVDYMGGVTMFNKQAFQELNGYSNNFWGWGGEDNEMMFHIKDTKWITSFAQVPQQFKSLPHSINGTFDIKKWEQAQLPRAYDDGLFNCQYEVLGVERNHLYTKITVEI